MYVIVLEINSMFVMHLHLVFHSRYLLALCLSVNSVSVYLCDPTPRTYKYSCEVYLKEFYV